MSNVLRGPLVFALLLAVLVGAGLYMRSRSSTASPAQPLSSLQIETKSADPSTLHPSYNDAVAALAAGDVEEARRLCDAVPREDRSYALAQNMAAGIEARTGAFDSALRRLDEISALQPENPEIHLVRAKTLVLADRGAEAEFEALRALELNPILVSARYVVALSRVSQGRMIDGMAAYTRARNQDGAGRGQADAFNDLQQLRLRRPELAGAHYATAWFASNSGQIAVEREALESFLATDPAGEPAEQARRRLSRISN